MRIAVSVLKGSLLCLHKLNRLASQNSNTIVKGVISSETTNHCQTAVGEGGDNKQQKTNNSSSSKVLYYSIRLLNESVHSFIKLFTKPKKHVAQN